MDDLTPEERLLAAQGCRALAYIAEKDAAGAGNPEVHRGFLEHAEKLKKLAAKFEHG